MSLLRKDLRAISIDGAAANIMVGIGENYLPAFVLALTASPVACGLTPTVPQVLGAIVQMASPVLVARLGSYRRWVVLCAAIQAAVFVPLSIAAFGQKMSVAVAFAVISLYWATGLAGGPAWNTWVATLIPDRLRAAYLAGRARIAQGGLLLGILAGGLALQAAARWTDPILPFALLFLVAAASRSVSAMFLATQSEPSPPPVERRPCGFTHTFREVSRGTHGKVLGYMLLTQLAVQISGPYFTPYMLCQLELSYSGFVALTSAAYVAKIAFLPLAGRMAARWGASRLLWVGGIAISPVSALWVHHSAFGYLLAVQAVSGVAWSIYELAMLLVFVDTIPAERRVRILTLYNLVNAVAILTGSLIGGGLLSMLGERREAYWLLFTLSSLVRVMAVLLLTWMLQASSRAAAQPVLSAVPRPAMLPFVRARAARAGQRQWDLLRPVGTAATAVHHKAAAGPAARESGRGPLPACPAP